MSHVIYIGFMNRLKNCMKSLEFVLNTIFFVFVNVSKDFHEYVRTENMSYKIVWNYSKNYLNCFRYNIFCFDKYFKKISWIYKNGKSEL